MAIFDYINIPFSWLMRVFYSATHNYAIALLLFAIVIKIVLSPFGIKQQRNAQKQAKFQPLEMAIRKKYAGRNDKATQQKMQQEIMELYQKEGYNPMGGCLPLLLQLPIILSLYQIVMQPLRWICNLGTDVIENIFQTCKTFATQGLITAENTSAAIFNSLSSVDSAARFNQIDLITCIKAVGTDKFGELLSGVSLPDFHLFGNFADLSATPSFSPFNWLILIPVLVYLSQFFSTKLMRRFSYQPMQAQTDSSAKIMEYVMPLISVYLAFKLPAIVGLYWVYQSLVGAGQQMLLYKLMPIPKFSEEDVRAAERKMNSNKQQKKQVRSLHHIDDDDVLPPKFKEGEKIEREKDEGKKSPIEQAELKDADEKENREKE